jgi:hypothetical protein
VANRKVCVHQLIIGLSGYAQSGKDTVANVLVFKYEFERVAFADAIRSILWEMNPIVKDSGFTLQSVVHAYGWDKAKVMFSEVRRLLQELGVSSRNTLGEDVWVNAVLRKASDKTKNYVISDVRFENEAAIIKQMDGQLWRVKRPNVGAVNNHISESELDGYKVDQILNNGGTIEELELLVQQRMDALIANKTH